MSPPSRFVPPYRHAFGLAGCGALSQAESMGKRQGQRTPACGSTSLRLDRVVDRQANNGGKWQALI